MSPSGWCLQDQRLSGSEAWGPPTPNLNAWDTPLGWQGVGPAHALVTCQSQAGTSDVDRPQQRQL